MIKIPADGGIDAAVEAERNRCAEIAQEAAGRHKKNADRYFEGSQSNIVCLAKYQTAKDIAFSIRSGQP